MGFEKSSKSRDFLELEDKTMAAKKKKKKK